MSALALALTLNPNALSLSAALIVWVMAIRPSLVSNGF